MARLTDLSIYIYLRKSRKDIEMEKQAESSGENFDTLERHRRTLLAIAAQEGHTISDIFEEVVSGEFISERPQIQRLIREVEDGRVDAVLVMDIDRLGRGDMLDQGLLDRAFRYSGTKIITPNETYDPASETWELVFGIKSLVAREELKAITRRMQRGRHTSAAEGKSISKSPPYGYSRDDTLRLYPDVETAWVVKKMFEMMRDGYGRQAIAQELDRLGIKPPNPERKTWSPSSITSIIKNEVYLGRIIWGQVKYLKRNGKYQRKKMPRSEWIIKENAHEPLVTTELFEAANRAHTGRWRPSTVSSKKLSNPLAGIVKCEVCGYSLLYQPRPDRPNDFIRCTNPSCKGVQRGATLALVEKRILFGLEQLEEDMEFQSKQVYPSNKEDAPFKQMLIDKKLGEVADLEKQKSNLHDLLERGVYDVDTFIARQGNLSDRINTLRSEIRNLEIEIQKEFLRDKNLNDFLPRLRKVIDGYYDAEDAQRKNELLKTVLERVTYARSMESKRPDDFEITIYAKV